MRLGQAITEAARKPAFGVVALVAIVVVVALGITAVDRVFGPGEAGTGRGDLAAADVATERGLDLSTQTWSADAVDYDGDGWEDLFVVRHRFHPAQLFHNEGDGRFEAVENDAFFASFGADHDRHDCDWADVDHNGLIDAFCSVGSTRGRGEKANELWMQTEPANFEDQGDELGVVDPYGRGRFTTFIDANGDGWEDIYVTNFYPRQDGLPTPNVLFINEAGQSFRRATEFGLEHDLGGLSVQAVDYDQDGWEDLLVCGQEGLRLYRNLAGESFEDATASTGAGRPCRYALIAQLSGSKGSAPDLAVINEGHLEVMPGEQGRFGAPIEERKAITGRSLAAGDFNGDGRLDLYAMGGTTRQNIPDVLLLARNSHGFDRVPLPEGTADGVPDQVIAIDSDRDGRDEFLILNGRGQSEGPLELITAVPAND